MLSVELPWPVSEHGELVPESKITIVKLLELQINDLLEKNKQYQEKATPTSELINQMVSKALKGRTDSSAELIEVRKSLSHSQAIASSYLKQIGERAGEINALERKLSESESENELLLLEVNTLSAINTQQAKEIEAAELFRDENERTLTEFSLLKTKHKKLSEKIGDNNQEELNNLRSANGQLQAELKETKKALGVAKSEISGIPKLVKNKVATALSQYQKQNEGPSELEITLDGQLKTTRNELEIITDQLSETKATNASLNNALGKVKSDLSSQVELNALVDELAKSQAQEIVAMSESMRNCESNYKHIMYHLEELQGYASIISHENVGLRNDNLYLDQVRRLHNMRCVWAKDGWQAFFVERTSALDLPENAPRPDINYGVMFLLNTDTGGGHTAYFDENGDVIIAESVPRELHLPDEYLDSFKAGAKALPVKDIEASVIRGAARSRKLVEFARLLDIDWSTEASHVEIAQRLQDYVPESELNRVFTNIERAKAMAANSVSLMNRINKRFGTEYSLRDSGGIQKGIKHKNAPKANSRNKAKKQKRK